MISAAKAIMINAAVLTISDSVSAGTRADRSGPAVRERLERLGWSVPVVEVIPDVAPEISARLSALSVLVFGGPMRLTDLARLEQVKPPTMTRIVAGLEAQGLVRRRAVSGDARAVRLEATPRGTKVMHEGRRRRVERLTSALRTLSAGELQVLARAATLLEQTSVHVRCAGCRVVAGCGTRGGGE